MSNTINFPQTDKQAPSADYRLWSSTDIIEWIMSINTNYEKYREHLTTAFQDNNFSGRHIYNLDNADLQKFGIINRNDRNTIYTAMQQLIVEQKQRDSQISEISIENTQDTDHEIMTSPRLSEMVEEKEFEDDNHISDHPDLMLRAISQHYSYHEPLSEEEFEEMEFAIDYTAILWPREQFLNHFYGEKGFTEWVYQPQYEQTVDALTVGYIKHNADINSQQRGMLSDVYKIIVDYYSINETSFGDHVEVQSGQRTFFTLMTHISLSKILVSRAKQSTDNHIIIEQREVKPEIVEYILEYLAHHKENKFEHTLNPNTIDRNSMNTDQIVSNQWDRDWINRFDLETLSSIKEAARHLKIISLVQLAGIPIITQLFGLTAFLDRINNNILTNKPLI